MGTMIDSNIDPIDHPHIKGATVQNTEYLSEAIKKGTDKDWEARAGCMTFPDAVAKAAKSKGLADDAIAAWKKKALKMSLPQMREAAKKLGAGEVYFDIFAREYAKRGAAAYVQLIQREERKHGVETLTHQKWSGSELVDEAGNVISSGTSSTGIMSAGVTEKQF